MENIKLYFKSKVNVELLPKKYSILLNTEFTSIDQFNNLVKEYGLPIQKKEITYKCDICGKEFINDLTKFRTLLKSKYSLGIIICGDVKMSFECFSKKQRIINTYRKINSCSPAKGRILSEKEKIEAKIKRMESEGFKKYKDLVVGKSIEELYGKEKADSIKNKIREKRLNQKDPRTGCINTRESKQLMSEKRKEFLNKKEKKYVSPITGELVTYIEWFSQTMLNNWKNKTEDERLYLREKYIHRYITGKLIRNKNNSGYHTAWYNIGTKVEGKKDEVYLSNYELFYYLQLDVQKIYYKTNRIIYIPYLSPKDSQVHYYVPDIIIYKDSNFTNIDSIVEVKPYEFAINPQNRKSLYYEITKAKLEALTLYCKESNIDMKIITEKEMGLPYENRGETKRIIKEVINEYNKNKKN